MEGCVSGDFTQKQAFKMPLNMGVKCSDSETWGLNIVVMKKTS